MHSTEMKAKAWKCRLLVLEAGGGKVGGWWQWQSETECVSQWDVTKYGFQSVELLAGGDGPLSK